MATRKKAGKATGKVTHLRVRVTRMQLKQVQAAARKAGLTTSDWVRYVLLSATSAGAFRHPANK